MRPLAACLVGAIGIVGLVVCCIALWAHAVLFDPEATAGAAEAALEEPEVTEGLAAQVTTAAFEALDVEATVAGLAPDSIDPLVPALVGGVRVRVEAGVADLLADPTTRTLVVGAVERSHAALVRLLEGDGLADGVTIADGEITLNLLPVIARAFSVVADQGLFELGDIPELVPDGDPDDQRVALEEALGRDLPDGFGQLVVHRSERPSEAGGTLERAQQAVVLVKRSLALLVGVTVVCLAASVMLARRRRRALLVLAVVGAALFVVTRAVVGRVVAAAPDLVVDPAGRVAAAAIVGDLTTGLVAALSAGAFTAAVVAIVVYATAPGGPLRRLRSGAGSGAVASLSRLVAAHRDAAAVVALGLAVCVIAIAGLGTTSLVVASLLAVVAGATQIAFSGRGEPSADVSTTTGAPGDRP